MKRTKEKRGITLIALIITIIVLLILAGVTISMVVGDNGVLTQAQNAKIKTEKAKDEELRGLTAAEAGANLEGTIFTGTLTVKQEDGTEKSEEREVPIPVGFAVSQVEGENKIDDGLVVIDKNGNEFVWIPCDNVGTYINAGNYSKSIKNGGKGWSSYAYDIKVEGETAEAYQAKNWSNPTEQINTAKESIEKYKGFYVARYEAGVPSNAPFYVSNTSGGKYVGINGSSAVSIDEETLNARGANSETEKEKVQDLKPISKRGVQAWNFISQTNAVTVSENMYKDNDYVDSFLIDSNAWNYICEHKLKDIIGEDELTKDSSKRGNYYDNTTTDYTNLDCLWAKHTHNNGLSYAENYRKGNITTEAPRGKGNDRLELATGASDDFKIYNIYDMAGNMWEWTSETGKANGSSNGKTYAVFRGGSLQNTGKAVIVHSYGVGTNDYLFFYLGFRPVLYVK